MTRKQTNTVHGRVIYLLVLVIINQFAYPITARGRFYLIIYQILYASMFAAGIYVASAQRLFSRRQSTMGELAWRYFAQYQVRQKDIRLRCEFHEVWKCQVWCWQIRSQA